MINTVLMTGTGWTMNILYLALIRHYPDMTLTSCKKRWWQSEQRYQIRIQNMHKEDIQALQDSLNAYWPLGTPVDVKVF